MRIAVNTRVLSHPVTGVERYTLELLRRFGDSVAQIAPHSALGGVKGHAWEQLVLPAKLRGRLLFSPCNTGPLAVANQVVTIHDVAALDHPEWLNAKFALWYRWLTPRLARRVKHIIAVSEFTRGRIVAHTGVPAEKITVIPNGVDARFAPMAPDAIDAALAPLALPSRKYILAVGSIEPRKNLPRLLEAWGKILPTLPEDVWLVVAGGRNARVFSSMSTDHGSKVYPGAPGINDDGGDGGDGLQVTGDRAQGEQNLESRTLHSEGNEGATNNDSDPQITQISQINDGGGFTTEVGEAAEGTGEKLEVRSWKLEDGATSQASPAGLIESAALPQHSNSYLLAPSSCEPGAPRVHFAGRVAEGVLPALYAGAMAFAYVSVYEGFGLPPLEAMAAGVPVLTGNLTSLPEVVGDAGIMVDPLDVDAIANGLRQLVENAELRARLSGAGIDRAKQFTWDRAAERTLSVLEAGGIPLGKI